MDAPSVLAMLDPAALPPWARRRPLRLMMAQDCRSHMWLSQQSGGANSLRGGAPRFGQLQMAPDEATSAAPRAATRLAVQTPSQHERSTNTVVQQKSGRFRRRLLMSTPLARAPSVLLGTMSQFATRHRSLADSIEGEEASHTIVNWRPDFIDRRCSSTRNRTKITSWKYCQEGFC